VTETPPAASVEEPAAPSAPASPDNPLEVRVVLSLPAGVRARVTVEAFPDGNAPATQQSFSFPIEIEKENGRPYPATAERWRTRLRALLSRRNLTLEMVLFSLALLVYLATHLIGLEDFPSYFFVDEAVNPVLAEDFVHNGFRNTQGEFFPTYFQIDPTYNLLSVSVYLQVIPYLLFGKSVFVTRAVSVMVTLLAALVVGLILRDIFKVRHWWSTTLLLSSAPIWFLHSRTAFEVAEMVSFYAGFLYFYWLYRFRRPLYLFPALVLGALVFYTYSLGPLLMLVTGLLFLFSDLRYHWQQRRWALGGLALLVGLALPFVIFFVKSQSLFYLSVRTRGSFWSDAIPLQDKLLRAATEYLTALNPAYWYVPAVDPAGAVVRHLMKGYGHLLWVTFPFLIIGFVLTLRRVREPAHRALLLVLLASPLIVLPVGVGITRVLQCTIPMVLLMGIGFSATLEWLEKIASRLKKLPPLPAGSLAVGAFTILAAINGFLLFDSLANGPAWFNPMDLQYGGRQFFGAAREYMERAPQTQMIISPVWANGADVLARFFIPDTLLGSSVQVGSIAGHIDHQLPLTDETVFLITPPEYQVAVESGRFKNIFIEDTLPYPTGDPAMYFVRAQYVDDIEAVFSGEHADRLQLVDGTFSLDGQIIQVRHSPLDSGLVEQLFDGDDFTWIRTWEANPLILEFTFPEPRRLTGFSMIVRGVEARLTVDLYTRLEAPPITYSEIKQGTDDEPKVSMDFDSPVLAQKLRLTVEDVNSGQPAHVHMWELELR